MKPRFKPGSVETLTAELTDAIAIFTAGNHRQVQLNGKPMPPQAIVGAVAVRAVYVLQQVALGAGMPSAQFEDFMRTVAGMVARGEAVAPPGPTLDA